MRLFAEGRLQSLMGYPIADKKWILSIQEVYTSWIKRIQSGGFSLATSGCRPAGTHNYRHGLAYSPWQ